MAKRRKRGGLGAAEGSAISWLSSAVTNFRRIQTRNTTANNPCGAIEHYTDVVAEATAAEAVAGPGSAVARRASNLASEATRAQRTAVIACRHQAKRGGS